MGRRRDAVHVGRAQTRAIRPVAGQIACGENGLFLSELDGGDLLGDDLLDGLAHALLDLLVGRGQGSSRRDASVHVKVTG